MQFIDEATIDAVAVRLGSLEAAREAAINALEEEQPVLLAYIFSESFDAFLPKEKEFILFLVIIILEAIRESTKAPVPFISEEALSEAEEANWEIMQGVTTQRFRERLDVFFEHSEQEDLLAFIEDALIDEEDDLLSKEGREPIFIVLKSIIDALDQLPAPGNQA